MPPLLSMASAVKDGKDWLPAQPVHLLHSHAEARWPAGAVNATSSAK